MTLSFYSPPPKPENERERQRAVNASGILRAPPDPTLHAIVSKAAELFDAPIAAVSIVDHDRQWFAARVGLEVSETSRTVSLCAHAILAPEQMLVVPDAQCDDRFAGNPLVLFDPAIRFYVGVPLTGPKELPLGALCVIDRKPRHGTLPLDELRSLAFRAAEEIAQIRRVEQLPA